MPDGKNGPKYAENRPYGGWYRALEPGRRLSIPYALLRAGLAAQAVLDPGRPGVLRLYPGRPVIPGDLVYMLVPDLVAAAELYKTSLRPCAGPPRLSAVDPLATRRGAPVRAPGPVARFCVAPAPGVRPPCTVPTAPRASCVIPRPYASSYRYTTSPRPETPYEARRSPRRRPDVFSYRIVHPTTPVMRSRPRPKHCKIHGWWSVLAGVVYSGMWAPGEHPRGSRQGGALADNSFTHLVVVGSSAGGITALSGLVSSLPEEFDAPIVVAQHLDPNRESHLQEILARRSPLPVKTVTEHEPLQAGVVFVVPANRHVNITDSEIDFSSEPSSGPPMPSINLLMETAARSSERTSSPSS